MRMMRARKEDGNGEDEADNEFDEYDDDDNQKDYDDCDAQQQDGEDDDAHDHRSTTS